MAANLATIIQIHKTCGCPDIDAATVKVSKVCLSTDDTVSGLTEWGEQILVQHVTAAPAEDLTGLTQGSDTKLETIAGVVHANTSTYSYGSAKAVVYDDGTDAYLAYIQNLTSGNGDMDLLLKKLFSKLLNDDGRNLFYFRLTALNPAQIDSFEANFTISTIGTYELYVE